MLPSGVHLNKTGLVIGVGVLATILYIIYNAISPKSIGIAVPNSSLELSIDVLEKLDTIIVSEKTITMNKKTLFYREALAQPTPLESRSPVIMLHGMGDSSDNWFKIKTIQVCAALGHRTVAIDLPGHGKTNASALPGRGEFLEEVLRLLELKRPIIIAASMGGSYALPYIMKPKPESCEERAAGFVPIAIVGTDGYKDAEYHRCPVPTLIVYGTNDTRLGLNSVGNLRNMLHNEIFSMEKAGHACHHEQPLLWHNRLTQFLNKLPKTN